LQRLSIEEYKKSHQRLVNMHGPFVGHEYGVFKALHSITRGVNEMHYDTALIYQNINHSAYVHSTFFGQTENRFILLIPVGLIRDCA